MFRMVAVLLLVPSVCSAGISFGVLPVSSARESAVESPGLERAGVKIRPDLGSGINTDAGVLTCLHVVSDAIAKGKSIEVDCGGDVAKATLIFQDPKTDVAILKAAWKSEHPTIALRGELPKPGDRLQSIARLRDGTIGVESHRVTGTAHDGLIVVDNPFISGSSGGAVLNDEGELIGIVSGNIVTAEPWKGLVIPVKELPTARSGVQVQPTAGSAPARSVAVQAGPVYQVQCNGRGCRRVRIR